MGLRIENYLQIQSWMITGLGLQGNELICYSIIFGLCQDGSSKDISLAYFQNWINLDKRSLRYILAALKEKGLINAVCNKGKLTSYSINPMAIKNGIRKAIDSEEDDRQEHGKSFTPKTFLLNTFVNETIKEYVKNKSNSNLSPREPKEKEEIRKIILNSNWTIDN